MAATPRPSPERERPRQTEPVVLPRAPRRRWPWIAALAVVLVGVYLFRGRAPQEGAGAPGAKGGAPPVPVVASPAREGDLPVYLNALGTVTAFNTVTVKSRVDGQLVKIDFQEGQLVKEGDLLAQVDPRPFEVQLTQAQGALARDRAQLQDAQLTLKRYQELFGEHVVSKQELDDQVSKAGQFEGAIVADQGLIDSAKLQLTYARITAPIGGRAGLRLVDVGNIVHANDTTGLVVITQLQPIALLFTIPQDDLPAVMQKMTAGETLAVNAYDRGGQKQLATGTLLTVDNRIDQSTGTTRLKAVFPNDDGSLFPNQFVNVRLLVDTKRGTVIVPVAAVQRGPQGNFAYVVKSDQTVEVRPVTVGPTSGDDAAIESGLAANEQVVTDGVDKLRAGSPVRVRAPAPPAS
jgi:multidrug efflux system membrane fusion protein